ncbi:MAG: response regulator transcription factor [Melioribacteraceae bacterium]|nr:response regulator transcription factor [Melioribacteraceae bacterium]
MIKVAIIEDNFEVALGLKHLVNFSDGFECVGVYSKYSDAIDDMKNVNPDVLLLDIYLPDKLGTECIREIKSFCTKTEIIMLTSSDNDNHIFDSLKAGAAGYLMKNSTATQIIDAIKTVLDGGAPMSNEVARKVITSLQKERVEYDFSKREMEIVELLINGSSIKTIAETLFVETTTVKFHLSNIYKKLGVSSKAEAISKILKEQLL